MILHQCEQGTVDWRKVRAGKLTGSNAQTIATNGKGLETLCLETCAEKFCSIVEQGYTNEAMQNGVDLEATARSLYELENDVTVEQVGFIERDEFVGVSPDGLINEDGGIEIKCHGAKEHLRLLVGGEIDKKYWWQCQMFLLVTGRKWIDYVAFNPNFTRDKHIVRIEPDQEAFEKLEAGIEKGIELIKELSAKYGRKTIC